MAISVSCLLATKSKLGVNGNFASKHQKATCGTRGVVGIFFYHKAVVGSNSRAPIVHTYTQTHPQIYLRYITDSALAITCSYVSS